MFCWRQTGRRFSFVSCSPTASSLKPRRPDWPGVGDNYLLRASGKRCRLLLRRPTQRDLARGTVGLAHPDVGSRAMPTVISAGHGFATGPPGRPTARRALQGSRSFRPSGLRVSPYSVGCPGGDLGMNRAFSSHAAAASLAGGGDVTRDIRSRRFWPQNAKE